MKDRVVFSKTELFYYEATAAGVDKGTGLERLCNYLKIAPENVMALGDQANDAPMLEYAGIGVAMGNAVDYTKKHADAVTADCDHDGVAVAINKFAK
ncbi:Sugar phosphatase YidA [Lactobacillus helveticus]|nr:Sugar phosphatase YidA [Lactobacillus helveticus]NRO20021.1 Sugar phosphatase YidA [Lactobacillus helveticus]NRO32196.1 Sugar phosphatase YidA [Lactobacillus helveticus]NRO40347.1 Sugar phosphatase YidA [Lactobacillus helveticus]NRO46334.1 Sugar phosphatase YidA [Lactobacillus helveticus]